MVTLLSILFLILIFSFQTTFLELFSLAGVVPDLALITAVYCGIFFRGTTGIGMGFIIGFIQDCLSGAILGINTLSKSLISFFFANLKDKIIVDNFIPIFFFLFLASMFDSMVFYIISGMLVEAKFFSGFHLPSILMFAFYNAALGPLFFFFFNKLKKVVDKRVDARSFHKL